MQYPNRGKTKNVDQTNGPNGLANTHIGDSRTVRMAWPIHTHIGEFPARAPTRTWMFLTFAVFVGLAAGGIAFFLTLDLSDRIHNAAHHSYLVDTEHLASLILSTEDLTSKIPHKRVGSLDTTAAVVLQLEDLHIFVGQHDSLYWKNAPLEDPIILDILSRTSAEEPFFDIITIGNGQRMRVGAIRQDGVVIGLVRPVSALYVLATNMRNRMILGIGLALFMSMIGAWIASNQVTKPLRKIMKTTRQIVAGEYGTPIRVASRAAEFQDLGHNLEYMSRIYTEKIHELENVTRLQREFINNVSHEVLNPIFAISGFLEALGSPKLSEKHRQRYSKKGLQNLQRLSNLFSSLIDIAKLENRDQPLNLSRCNLATLALDAKDILIHQAQKKNLQLELDEEDTWVQADRDQIRQVFQNLIHNAIRYSTSGTVRCRFRKRLDKVCVEVIDEGQGIPENHLSLIFERFHRVDRSRARRDGGIGLGLAIVKQILQEHGESIHVESIVGQGSRFWFELSLSPEQPEP